MSLWYNHVKRMVLGARTQATIYLMKHKPNLNTRPVSGLGSDVCECLIEAVPVGTRQLLSKQKGFIIIIVWIDSFSS